jgi:hypothetical protein
VAKIAAREAFDAKEMAPYAIDLDAQVEAQGILDAQVEAQGVLDTARAATRLRGELRGELWVDGSGTGGNSIKEEFVHLDNDDLDTDNLACLELPTTRKPRGPLPSRGC